MRPFQDPRLHAESWDTPASSWMASNSPPAALNSEQRPWAPSSLEEFTDLDTIWTNPFETSSGPYLTSETDAIWPQSASNGSAVEIEPCHQIELDAPQPQLEGEQQRPFRHSQMTIPSTYSSSDTGLVSLSTDNTTSSSLSAERHYKCSTCSKSFRERGSLRFHERNHDPSKKAAFTCELCGRSFRYPKDLARHGVARHSDRGKPNHSCEYTGCDKSYVRRDHLLRHMDRAHNLRPNFLPLSGKADGRE